MYTAILKGHFNPVGGEFTDDNTGEKREFLNLDVSWGGGSSQFGVLPELREQVKALATPKDGMLIHHVVVEIDQRAIFGQAKGKKDTIVSIESIKTFRLNAQEVQPAKNQAAAAS